MAEDGDDISDDGGLIEGRRRCCCFGCCRCRRMSKRAAAFCVCAVLPLFNVAIVTMCIVLTKRNTVPNDQFNYIFIAVINVIMFLSHVILIHGIRIQQQKFLMTWFVLYAVLLFLENIVGLAAFVLAIAAHALVTAMLPMVLLLIFDGFYIIGLAIIYRFYGICTENPLQDEQPSRQPLLSANLSGRQGGFSLYSAI